MSIQENNDLIERIHALETAQAVQAATQSGAHATQAAAHAGTWSTMVAAGACLAGGIFLGMAISKSS
jgi:hypothetical protein